MKKLNTPKAMVEFVSKFHSCFPMLEIVNHMEYCTACFPRNTCNVLYNLVVVT